MLHCNLVVFSGFFNVIFDFIPVVQQQQVIIYIFIVSIGILAPIFKLWLSEWVIFFALPQYSISTMLSAKSSLNEFEFGNFGEISFTNGRWTTEDEIKWRLQKCEENLRMKCVQVLLVQR